MTCDQKLKDDIKENRDRRTKKWLYGSKKDAKRISIERKIKGNRK